MANAREGMMLAHEAARVIGVCRKTVSRLVARGEIDVAAKTAAGYPLFLPEEVERVRIDRIKNPPHMGRPSRAMLEERKRKRRVKKRT